MIFYSILFAILLNSLCIFTQITLQRYELYLILPNFFLILFCISLDLDNFLTLKNANIFVFFSLNRNFALSLALPKILSFEKTQNIFGFLLTYSYLCNQNR